MDTKEGLCFGVLEQKSKRKEGDKQASLYNDIYIYTPVIFDNK